MLNDLSEIEKSEPLDGSLYEQNGANHTHKGVGFLPPKT